MWLLILPYILCAISLVYSSDLNAGVFVLDKKIGLLILPLVLGTIPKITSRQFEQLILVACVSITVVLLYCLFSAVYRHMHHIPGGFFWRDLTIPIDEFHPTYLSIYLNFLMTCLGFYLFERRFTESFIPKFLIIALIGFFYICLILLSSKIQLINSIFILLFFIIRFSKTINLKIVIPVILIIIVAIVGFIKTSYTWERFTNINTLHYKLNAPVETFNELTIRFGIMECSWDILKDHLLLGVGIGDVNSELDKSYRKFDFKFGYLDSLNPHNEYLSQLLALGLVGLILFLTTLALLVKKALERMDVLYLIFLMLFIVSCLFESMLERQKGIIFFALFNSLFLFHRRKSRA